MRQHQQGVERVGVLNEMSPNGQEYFDSFRRAADEFGLQIIGIESITQAPADLEARLARLQANGAEGLAYPWGNLYDPEKLNSAVKGPHDTTPVGQFSTGASPYGLLDAAGNVFQWTSTRFKADRMTVKGSAWDDFAGVGRGASRHGRPATARHVIVGFRCAAPAS